MLMRTDPSVSWTGGQKDGTRTHGHAVPCRGDALHAGDR